MRSLHVKSDYQLAALLMVNSNLVGRFLLADCNWLTNTRKSVVELADSVVKSANSLVESAAFTADLVKSWPLVLGLKLDVFQHVGILKHKPSCCAGFSLVLRWIRN